MVIMAEKTKIVFKKQVDRLTIKSLENQKIKSWELEVKDYLVWDNKSLAVQ